MDVTHVLKAAWQAVDRAEIPSELQPIAFQKAVELLVGSSQQTLPSKESNGPREDSSTAESSNNQSLGRLANRLNLDRSIVAEVFHEENGEVIPTVSVSQLSSQVKEAAQQIALLVTAARQLTGLEEATAQTVVRELANDYNKVDSNFSRNIDAMSDSFSFIGSGRSRRMKLKRTGIEKASRLVNEISGGES